MRSTTWIAARGFAGEKICPLGHGYLAPTLEHCQYLKRTSTSSAPTPFAKRPPEVKSAKHRKHAESGGGGISQCRATAITNLEKRRGTDRANTVAAIQPRTLYRPLQCRSRCGTTTDHSDPFFSLLRSFFFPRNCQRSRGQPESSGGEPDHLQQTRRRSPRGSMLAARDEWPQGMSSRRSRNPTTGLQRHAWTGRELFNVDGFHLQLRGLIHGIQGLDSNVRI